MDLFELMANTQMTSDACIKCNICTSNCPVSAVTDKFPGPKVVGPQAQRFREPGQVSVDRSVDYCSGCGTCSVVCPHGVQIAEMNVIAKAALAERNGIPLRNRILGRSELMGQLGSLFAPLSDIPMQIKALRRIGEWTLGVSHQPVFPRFARQPFGRWFKRSGLDESQEGAFKVAYFHGCSTNYWEPQVGRAAVKVLKRLGCAVAVPRQNCCGLPLQSNGEFNAARSLARANLASLADYVRRGYVIVSTSTSCLFTLKHEYRAVLGIHSEEADLVAGAAYDFCEFLQMLEAQGLLAADWAPVDERLVYHWSCQLRTHGVGKPAVDVLRRIPGLTLLQTQSDCCGVAGTYGMKAEKYPIARDVGSQVFEEIRASQAQRIVCDNETCRWWLTTHTGLKAVHPAQVLAQAYGIEV
jgi:glycerol-3-phosphate dehydrogenase subunit C